MNKSFISDKSFIREGVTIGDNTIIGPFVCIEPNARIGNNVTIQPFSIIARDMIIEDNVFIGPHFSMADTPIMSTGEHGLSKKKQKVPQYTSIIQENTSIGTRCTLAPGITIGHHCIIKMNAFIKKDVPPYSTIKAGITWDYDS